MMDDFDFDDLTPEEQAKLTIDDIVTESDKVLCRVGYSLLEQASEIAKVFADRNPMNVSNAYISSLMMAFVDKFLGRKLSAADAVTLCDALRSGAPITRRTDD